MRSRCSRSTSCCWSRAPATPRSAAGSAQGAVLAALRHVEVLQAGSRGGEQPLAASYAALGVPRDIAVVVPTFVAAAAIVAGSELVASLPDSLLGVLAPRLALRRVTTPLAPVGTNINMLWHERTHQDPALRAFRELLVHAAVGSPRPPAARR